jgi:hypothetical protein
MTSMASAIQAIPAYTSMNHWKRPKPHMLMASSAV